MPGIPWFFYGNAAPTLPGGLVPSESQINTALRDFLMLICPGVEVVSGWDNRVAEPPGSNYIVFWPIRRDRLATNKDDYEDDAFIGSIAGSSLTISEVLTGRIDVGSRLYGAEIAPNTKVTGFVTGDLGGVGTYSVNNAQNVPSTIIQTGTQSFTQATDLVFQIEPHGPQAADMAQTISTMMRDDFAVQYFNEIDPAITPLHADDPTFVPFINDQKQVEQKWVVIAHIEADQTNTFPQQFMTAITVNLIEVDERFKVT